MAVGAGRTRATRRRSNAERSAHTRGQLIEGAIRSLRELGFARTTTATICGRAGVTTGALHHHFATKEELLFAVLDRLSQDVAGQLEGFLRFEGPIELEAARAVRRLWSVYGGVRYRAVWEITIGYSSEPRLRAAMTRQRNTATEALIERLASARGLARRERQDFAAAMRFALIAIRGLFLDTFLEFGRQHFEQQLALIARAVAAQLQPILGRRGALARAA